MNPLTLVAGTPHEAAHLLVAMARAEEPARLPFEYLDDFLHSLANECVEQEACELVAPLAAIAVEVEALRIREAN
jgi:hypothetical protein